MKGMVLRSRGGLRFFAGRHGVAVPLHQPEMKAKQRQKQRGQHHDVQGEEALHREFAYIRAAAQHVGNGRTDQRNRRGNLQADLGGEVAELVHRQQVAGEAEDRGDAEQRHAAEPAELARLAIGLHEEDREHVHQDGEDHQVGRPRVRRADEPAEVHHKRDLADRLVGLGAGPVVDQQQHAGEALHEEEEERDAAPVVPERLRVDRDGLLARKGGELREAEALIDPVVD